MLLSKERLLYLLNAWSDGKATGMEEQELFAWVNESGNHEFLLQHIEKLVGQYNPKEKEDIAPVNWEHLYEQIIDKCVTPRQHVLLRKMSWVGWSAAAIVILLLGTTAYLYSTHNSLKEVVVQPIKKPVPQDVPAPVKSKAVLTLADGSRIELDSMANGTLAQQGNVQVVKQADGQITYNGKGSEGLYNMLNVPRGSKVVTIKLSDGTMVWLNSESSLRYPASFTGTERKVEITGEAYFEVAHNPAMPFIVKKEAMEIKVLGTHFNINTYADERVNKITLLEGSISVSINDQEDLMRPGQQAQVNNKIKLVNGVDIEAVMAWKNGIFQFGDKMDLQLIMGKIARWYDVDIDYQGGAINQKFGGEIPMNSNLSEVLEILKTSGVKFTIDGKKVMVIP